MSASGFLGPPVKPKPVHRAKLLRSDGKVSPLCAKRPRILNLAREIWTIVDDLVTCERCKPLLASNAAAVAAERAAR